MPKTHISRTITINKPVNEIYNYLNDFNNWQAWSPWIIQEPETKVTVSEDAKYYEWEGNRTGVGNMTITSAKENESIDVDLLFLKPWKSKAKVRFEFKSAGEGTEVTWLMDSSLPLLMFWMKKMMEAFVGMDYERGLLMLKDYMEDGKVHSKLDFKGASNFDGCNYIGIRTACTKAQMPEKMKADFGKLHQYFEENKDNIAGQPFTIYHKWDMVKDQIEYTSGFPVKEVPGTLSSGMMSGNIPKTPIHTVGHTGPYQHLGNAWTTMYGMQRSKTFKQNKKIDPFEIYLNNPMEVDEKELMTEVNFATK
jgi:effector-binding domain-containing protein